MKILSLQSSNIMAVGYDPTKENLYLHFAGDRDDLAGPWYSYDTFNEEALLVHFLFADSPGAFFAEHIRPFYSGRKLTLAQVQEMRFHV